MEESEVEAEEEAEDEPELQGVHGRLSPAVGSVGECP